MNTRTTWSPVADLFDHWLPATQEYSFNTQGRLDPTYEIDEEKDHYLISLEIPGVKKDDLKVAFVEDRILISGERRYSELNTKKFQRAFTLPPGVNSQNVEAHYEDGILKVAIPKPEAVKPKEIKISVGNEGSKFFSKFLTSGTKKENLAS